MQYRPSRMSPSCTLIVGSINSVVTALPTESLRRGCYYRTACCYRALMRSLPMKHDVAMKHQLRDRRTPGKPRAGAIRPSVHFGFAMTIYTVDE
jgi:hypothetical protein